MSRTVSVHSDGKGDEKRDISSVASRLAPWLLLGNLLHDEERIPDPSVLESAFGGWGALQTYHLHETTRRVSVLKKFFDGFGRTRFRKRFQLWPDVAAYQAYFVVQRTLLGLAYSKERGRLPLIAVHFDQGLEVDPGGLIRKASDGGPSSRIPPKFILGAPWAIDLRAYRLVDEFLRALEGCDVARIRVCPICRRFFYAARSDQKACAKPATCGQTHRQRTKREYDRTEQQRHLAAKEYGARRRLTGRAQ